MHSLTHYLLPCGAARVSIDNAHQIPHSTPKPTTAPPETVQILDRPEHTRHACIVYIYLLVTLPFSVPKSLRECAIYSPMTAPMDANGRYSAEHCRAVIQMIWRHNLLRPAPGSQSSSQDAFNPN